MQTAQLPNTAKTIKSSIQIFPFSRLSSPEHLHSSFEIIVPSAGVVRAGIGGQEYSFTVGEMLVIFPGMQHSYIRSENCRGVALTFSQEMLASLERDFSALQPEFPILRIDDLDRDVPYCLDRLKEMQAQSMMNEELAEAYLSLMFLRLLPQLQPRARMTTSGRRMRTSLN